MSRRLPLIAWITVVWCALWGELSPGNVLGGVAVGALLVAAVEPPATRRNLRRMSLGAWLVYTAVFLRDLALATLEVAGQVFWPVHRLRPAVLEVPMASVDPGLLTLVANTITLTPGTLTLEVDSHRGVLWVHVLHLRPGGADAVIGDARALERRAARALGVPLPDVGPSQERRP